MQPPQYSITRTIALSLLPGLGITILYVAFSPLASSGGLPRVFALLAAALIGVPTFELGYLLVQARRSAAGPSLTSVIDYKERVPAWQIIVAVLLFLVWGFLITGILSQVEAELGAKGFAWLPGWSATMDPNVIARSSRGAIRAAFFFGLVVNGLIVPIIEELYFRGHLLARISRFGAWAPVISVSLFSLYHFWAPWGFVSRVGLMLPLAYFAQWKRNVVVPIACHCAVNIVGWILTFGLVSSLA
jgi:membrane protease YdiL (CAAX protease family)